MQPEKLNGIISLFQARCVFLSASLVCRQENYFLEELHVLVVD